MRCVLVLMVMATALPAQSVHSTQTKPKTKSNTPAAAHSAAKTTPTAKSPSTGKQVTRTAGTRRLVNGRWVASSRRVPSKPVGQQHPEPDRYQEIQKALQERGYLKSEPSGEWNDDSATALKHFQADQNLSNDGKINSLTLIGLGLGPKHDGGPVIPPPAAKLPPATQPPISPETLPASSTNKSQ